MKNIILKKLFKSVIIILLFAVPILTFASCKRDFGFESHCKTTNDGYKYYYNDNSKKGAYIIDIPDVEDLVIPEYIDEKKVVELGHHYTNIGYYKDYEIYGEKTKRLTVQHEFYIRYKELLSCYICFPHLTTLVFIDFLYCNLEYNQDTLKVPYSVGNKYDIDIPAVELRKSSRKYSLEKFTPKTIIIPEYVEIIDADVFAGLKNVTIKTSYETKPEGWQEGWNGDCIVEWGVEIDKN